jgi:hypothetical protein
MACERYRDALSDLAAGAAAPAFLEAHLAECGACRAELAALRRALGLVDDELAGLSVAEPSPELAARVRSAVAASEVSSGRRLGWLLPGLAAAAALVVAAVLAVGRAPSPELEQAAHVTPSGASAEASVPEPEPEPRAAMAAAPVSRESAEEHTPVERPRAAPAEPEVLVPPGEAEALLRLVALVHREKLTPPVLSNVGEPVADLAELAPIEIEPLEIVALDTAEASGTD